MSQKRVVLKKSIRAALFFIIIFINSVALYLIITSYNMPDPNLNKIYYTYNVKQDLDYKVNIYDNSYFEKDVLESDESYIADLVKNIDVDFKYKYSGSKLTNLNYKYNVKAIINGKYNIEDEENKILKKEYILVNDVNKTISDSTNLTIDQPIIIDYKFYNDVITKFRQELKIPITSSLNIEFNVEVDGIVEGKHIKEANVMSITIPLNQQAFKIEKNYEESYSKIIRPTIKKQSMFNFRKLICGCILIIIGIFIFILTYKDIFLIRKKTLFNSKLKKILKEYGSVIVEIVSPISEENFDIIDVKNFNEMVDLEEELRTPINYYETIEDYEGVFILINNNLLYKYVLDNETKNL